MIFKLRIDNWTPTRANELRGHWAKASRLKKIDKNMVCGYVSLNRIPVAQGPREVSLRITLPPAARGKDEDAFWKSTLDALVQAKMLIDDCTQYCRTGAVEIVTGPRETMITLTDLYPEAT